MRAPWVAVLVALAVVGASCRGVLKKEYEYEEDLYLALDGTATLYVNASVPALVALRGFDLDVNPRARLDRQRVRTMFQAPNLDVSRVSLSRRHRRRFVHVRIDANRVEDLHGLAPSAWSTYSLVRRDDVIEFHQRVGPPSGKTVPDAGWTGREQVAFRMHLPSRIPYHNAPSREVKRGNILEWEQPLADRLRGSPIEIEAHMETRSILYSTLMLFGGTVVAALLTLALVIWWIARKGRLPTVAEPQS